jgi:hypothetical protein
VTAEPPVMFRQPTDPPEPLPPLRSNQHIVKLHTEWARLHTMSAASQTFSARLRRKAHGAVSRLVGTADHQLLGDVVRAIDAITMRCDELTGRVANLQVTSDDLARALGQEVTQLRAAVERTSDSGPTASTPRNR